MGPAPPKMTGTKTAKPSGGVDNAEIQAIVDAIMAPDSAVPDLRDATLKGKNVMIDQSPD